MLTPISILGFLATVPVAGPSPAGDWLDLDAEIETLAAEVPESDAAPRVRGRLIGTWLHSRDPYLYTGSLEHVSGVDLRSARVEFLGEHGGWDWKLGSDLKGGTLELIDAWVRHDVVGSAALTAGRFKRPLLRASMLSSKYRLFWNRGNNGQQQKRRDYGAKLVGGGGRIHGALAVMNATDELEGAGFATFVGGRIQFDVAGAPFDKYEGAWGVEEGAHFGLAVIAGEDRGVPHGSFVGSELDFAAGGLHLGADAIRYADDYDTRHGLPAEMDPDATLGAHTDLPAAETNLAGATPVTVTGAWLFGGRFEVAARYESFDDAMDTRRASVSLGVYDAVLGPRSRFLIDYSTVESDNPLLEGEKVEVGFVLVFGE